MFTSWNLKNKKKKFLETKKFLKPKFEKITERNNNKKTNFIKTKIFLKPIKKTKHFLKTNI